MMEVYTTELHWQQTHMKLQGDVKDILENAKSAVLSTRSILEQYILSHPDFVNTLEPMEVDLNAPLFIRNMMVASQNAGVGPMATVAGGLSEVATETMIALGGKFALADNGGDISIKGNKPVTIGVYAGSNRVAGKVAFKIKPDELPMGVCTSAGSVGHSISLGDADAVIVFSNSAFLSDAAATSIANQVKSIDPEGSIQHALEQAEDMAEVRGCMVFIGDLVGRTGKIPDMVEVVDSDV
jgi:ApbE superfamily uncharacterized protein (UPF0280 family)